MKVLLAIDGSPCSEAAIAEVARLPWPRQSEVRVIPVDAPVDPGLLRGSPAVAFEEIIKRQRAESSKRLCDAAAALAQSTSGLQIATSLLEGWPRDVIVAEAERRGRIWSSSARMATDRSGGFFSARSRCLWHTTRRVRSSSSASRRRRPRPRPPAQLRKARERDRVW